MPPHEAENVDAGEHRAETEGERTPMPALRTGWLNTSASASATARPGENTPLLSGSISGLGAGSGTAGRNRTSVAGSSMISGSGASGYGHGHGHGRGRSDSRSSSPVALRPPLTENLPHGAGSAWAFAEPPPPGVEVSAARFCPSFLETEDLAARRRMPALGRGQCWVEIYSTALLASRVPYICVPPRLMVNLGKTPGSPTSHYRNSPRSYTKAPKTHAAERRAFCKFPLCFPFLSSCFPRRFLTSSTHISAFCLLPSASCRVWYSIPIWATHLLESSLNIVSVFSKPDRTSIGPWCSCLTLTLALSNLSRRSRSIGHNRTGCSVALINDRQRHWIQYHRRFHFRLGHIATASVQQPTQVGSCISLLTKS